MSEQDPVVIKPAAAPLSHLDKKATGSGINLDWRVVGVTIVVLAVLIFAFTWRPQIELPAPTANPAQPAPAEQDTNGAPNGADTGLAPFAQAQQQRAREQAQAALAQFVEQQIALEENMHVAEWGQENLDAAMALAQTGDSEFTAQRFDTALDTYQQAAQALADLIDEGDQIFNQHVQDAREFLANRQLQQAQQAINQALAIKGADTDALALKQRVDKLPDVIRLLRDAKNHELGERPQEALAVYEKIKKLDPQTEGLAALQAKAAAAQSNNRVAQHLSNGFKLLSNKQFDAARQAFNKALAIEPDNDIARGGLAQLAKENDLAIIKSHRTTAEAAIADEQWQAALDAYQAVLDMDKNVQFAVNGLRTAKAHQRASNLLQKISSEPHKLSRQQLYLDAIDILANAKKLDHIGPALQASIDNVDQLIVLYRDPVDVVLVSDNATEIIMSNVGQLGRFDRKTLSLRPGQYTIRGSQDGCRDIYMSIEVLPGIAEVDVSCQESL